MRVALAAVALFGCGRIGFGTVEGTVDGDTGDASGPCPTVMWFADRDSDGHGDPNAGSSGCSQPPGTSSSNDDCDDSDRFRFPGAPEVCDSADNDCDVATPEACPVLCTPIRRPPPDDDHRYLLCDVNNPWPAARTACQAEASDLMRLDDAVESAWFRIVANSMVAPQNVYLAGTDAAVEGAWVWPNGDVFWTGGATGVPVGGRYSNWATGEPNNNGAGENCLVIQTDDSWNDVSCSDTTMFACERD